VAVQLLAVLGSGADAVHKQHNRTRMGARKGGREPMDKHQGGIAALKAVPGNSENMFGPKAIMLDRKC